VRFESHITTATALAASLTGASRPTPFTWISQPANFDPEDSNEDDNSADPPELNPIVESERLLLTDVISGEIQEEVDGTDTIVQDTHAQMIWVPPVSQFVCPWILL
jgi:hypothetical protein